MAYQLHIERGGGIGIEEWKIAVSNTDGVRLFSNEASTTNPKTGEVIRLAFREGLTEVFSPKDKNWHPSFYLSNGIASFKPLSLPGSNPDFVWKAATALASRLNAVIRGDEGEIYDLKTGKARRIFQS